MAAMRRALQFLLMLAPLGLALSLSGCVTGTPLKTRTELSAGLAAGAGWREESFRTPVFQLRGWSKGLDAGAKTLVVYIEADGSPWVTRYKLASDPTPRDPLALRLAVKDPAPAVLYLARPCHHTRKTDPACRAEYWSSHRYAPEVIGSVSAAIDAAKARAGATAVRLVGYSGGGAVAALVAARRLDVAGLVTVAANLDHAAWTAHHKVTPLTGSLNPADNAARVQAIPQVHYVGADDRIVPREIVEAYVRRMSDRADTRIVEMKGFDHGCCWERAWPISQ